ncbi:MAG: putative O-linked N-acetylglucosamine transferase (SPINDLY family) [Arenicella sp.]|jgi:predicted O-linked N-acetylglucosamine transferase (SPINDLY family)
MKAVAVQLAADISPLASLRAALRNQMQHSPLSDAQEFTRELESLYRDML